MNLKNVLKIKCLDYYYRYKIARVKLYYKYHLKLHKNSCIKSLKLYHFVVRQTKNSVIFKAWCMAALGTVTVIKFSSIFDTVRKSVLDFL